MDTTGIKVFISGYEIKEKELEESNLTLELTFLTKDGSPRKYAEFFDAFDEFLTERYGSLTEPEPLFQVTSGYLGNDRE